MTPPYLASAAAASRWMSARLAGANDSEAWQRAMAGCKPRDFARALVGGAHGQGPVLLSVAIEGGSSVVKRGRPEEWRLSGHGNWRRLHLGAIEAAYGSTPYFIHLYPILKEVYSSVADGQYFSDLSAALNSAAMNFINAESLIPELQRLQQNRQDIFLHPTNKNFSVENYDFAFIDVIFKKGPESIFTLLTHHE